MRKRSARRDHVSSQPRSYPMTHCIRPLRLLRSSVRSLTSLLCIATSARAGLRAQVAPAAPAPTPSPPITAQEKALVLSPITVSTPFDIAYAARSTSPAWRHAESEPRSRLRRGRPPGQRLAHSPQGAPPASGLRPEFRADWVGRPTAQRKIVRPEKRRRWRKKEWGGEFFPSDEISVYPRLSGIFSEQVPPANHPTWFGPSACSASCSRNCVGGVARAWPRRRDRWRRW